MGYKVKGMHNLYNNVFNQTKGNSFSSDENNAPVIQLIYDMCEKIISEEYACVNLENKLVLAIGIRLKAEDYMIKKINDSEFVEKIEKNQTRDLYNMFEKMLPQNENALILLEQVNLITPENIHLNSFMYEPLLDMSELHLRDLFNDIVNLTQI